MGKCDVLSFFAVSICLLSVYSSPLKRFCEEGKKLMRTHESLSGKGTNGWPDVSILEVPEGDNASLFLRLNTTQQILVAKCDPRTDMEEDLFTGRLENLQKITETSIVIFNNTFIVKNAEKRHEGIYLVTLFLGGRVLAVINLTVYDSSSAEFPSSTASPEAGSKASQERTHWGSLAAICPAVLVIVLICCMKKRRRNELSPSTADWMVKFLDLGLLKCLIYKGTPEECSETSIGSKHRNLSSNLDIRLGARVFEGPPASIQSGSYPQVIGEGLLVTAVTWGGERGGSEKLLL